MPGMMEDAIIGLNFVLRKNTRKKEILERLHDVSREDLNKMSKPDLNDLLEQKQIYPTIVTTRTVSVRITAAMQAVLNAASQQLARDVCW